MEMQEKPTEAMEMQEKPSERKMYEEAALVEVKAEEEAETAHYDTLQSPTEDVYTETLFRTPKVKTTKEKQTEGNERLYRCGCLVLMGICFVLLLIVILLSLKLQTESCNNKECVCQNPVIQYKHLGCQQCAKDWLPYGRSCYLLSTFRLSWAESQKNCSSTGGSLAIISSRSVQTFLTNKGNLKYWIGLRQNSSGWNWINNSKLQESYWMGHTQQGDCAFINSEDSAESNWDKASCQALTYFICEQQLTASGFPA